MSAAISSFTRYTTLVGAAFAGAATASADDFIVFSAPYQTGTLSSFGTSISGTTSSGAWTATLSPDHMSAYLRASSADALELQTNFSSLNFNTTIVANYNVISFSYATDDNGGNSTFGYTINGTYTELTGSGTISDLVLTGGSTFGFRENVENYNYYGSTLTISNLTATSASAIPEPATTASWIGLGVVGLVAMREMRRRRRAATQI